MILSVYIVIFLKYTNVVTLCPYHEPLMAHMAQNSGYSLAQSKVAAMQSRFLLKIATEFI